MTIFTEATHRIRELRAADARSIAAIDGAHTGKARPKWWQQTIERHLAGKSRRVGLVAVEGPKERIVGFLLGQVRAFEFGSDECGWIWAVGVHPEHLHRGIGRALMQRAKERFADDGVLLLRTMVRKDDVTTLTFFRSGGFAAGPFVELELPIGDGATP
ncbi:MAG: GNAT family N-acetyltransferase [Planctomycetes bacterium]|nr:GNAT family N-acetyltransferase [Planctomycetota bacterium]MCC7171221.1 GNAT family N-acetyltransferase [Planctomycetota bacterium]